MIPGDIVIFGEKPCEMYLADPFGIGLVLGFSAGFLFGFCGLITLILITS